MTLEGLIKQYGDYPVMAIQQPRAWLTLEGISDIDNRNWRDYYRGMVFIHICKMYDWRDFQYLKTKVPNLPDPKLMNRGGIGGIAEIVDCVTEHESPWFFGEYGFVIRNARRIEFTPCRGNQFRFAKLSQWANWQHRPAKTKKLKSFKY